MVERRKAFVAGFPIHHSLSPLIHRFWLELYGIEGHYQACEVRGEDFPGFIHTLKESGFVGGNVTLPHKEQAFLLAHHCDEAAQAVGAANSLWFEGETLCASNSDIYGFGKNLDDFAPHWREGQTGLVLGAGGAARAVIFALRQQGFKKILLVNRTRERACVLAAHFGPVIKVIDWQEIDVHLGAADVIINTTSIGLAGDKTALPLDFTYAQNGAIVTDIVYHPLETPFLKAAVSQGLHVVDGLGMLLHQGVFGFERWFGVRPVVSEELRHFILSGLRDRGA